jgi:uncharacterized protein
MARTLTRTVAAPEHMGVEMARVPAGADVTLDLQLEGVSEGVLVTADVTAPLTGECARCLEPFSTATQVRFQELFRLEEPDAEGGDPGDEDGYLLDGSGQLDLESALRDAVVLELPLSPLCEASCQGLCVECGVRLAEAEPGHRHEQRGPLWAALKDYQASGAGSEDAPAGNAGQGR